MKKALLLSLALATTATLHAEQNSAIMVNIKSLDAVIEDLSQLGQTLEIPIPAQMIPMQLGQLMMSPGMEGIDTSKPLTLFLGRQENPQPGPPRIVTRFSVKGDGTEYLNSIKRMLPHHEHETETIHKFPMAGPGADGPAYYVVMKNGQALSGQSLKDIKSMGADLGEKTKTLFNSMSGNLSISVNTDVMREAIEQQMEAQKKMMKTAQDSMAQQGIDADTPFQGNPVEIMDSYNKMIQDLFVQFDQFVLNIDVDKQITIRTHVKAKPESTLQKMITESAPVTGQAATYATDKAAITAYGSLAGMDDLLVPYGEWISDVYSSMGPPMDKMAAPYREMMETMKGIYQGDYSFAWLPPKGDDVLRMAGMYGISNKATAKAAMDKIMDLQTEMLADIEDAPMTISMKRLSADSYKGIEIERLTLSYAFSTNMPGMTPATMNILSNMNYLVAYTDDSMYYSMGNEETLHDMIDHFTTASDAPAIRPGFEDVDQPLHGYWNIDFASFFSAFSPFIPKDTPGMEDVYKKLEGIHAGLRGASFTEQGGYTSLLRMTTEDLQGLMKMGETLKPKTQPTSPTTY